jgi:SHS2 domain-containing protein
MTSETFAYFDHEADMGVVGRGSTVEAAFEAVAEAVFALMVDLASLRPEVTLRVEFEEADPELALLTWLNHLLGQARGRPGPGPLPPASG